MARIPNLLLSSALVAQLAVIAYATYDVVTPIYSDSDIRGSIVDTWQVSASWALFVVISSLVSIGIALVARSRSAEMEFRRIALGYVLVSVLAVSVRLWSHNRITDRAEQVAGHDLGRLLGVM